MLCCVQTLHIVRHGESTYNAASRSGSGFSDPQIFDPVLTEKGRRQVHIPVSIASLSITQHIAALHGDPYYFWQILLYSCVYL